MIDESRNADRTELSHAYKFLTNYHLSRDHLDQAHHYAQKCLQFEETKEEAKALLRTIAQKRVEVEDNPMVVSKKFLTCTHKKKPKKNQNLDINFMLTD